MLNPTYTPGLNDLNNGFAILSLTAFGNGSCEDSTDSMVLTITQAPEVYAGADAEICETAGSYTISDATASNYAGLLWMTSGDGTFDDATLLNPTYTPGSGDITGGSVTLSLTAFGNGTCADTTDSMVLTITLAPSAYAGADAEICETDGSYTIADATASNYANLLWISSGDGWFDDVTLLNPTYTPGLNDLNNGSVTLTLIAFGNGSCADSTDSMVLTIIPAPTAYAGDDAEICETEPFYTIDDATATNYTSLLWTTSGDGTFDDATLLNPTYFPGSGDIAAGSVTLTLTAGGNAPCGDVTDEMILTITPEPTAYAGEDAEICDTDTSYTIIGATATNYSLLYWTSSGDGYFDDPYQLNPTYYPGINDRINGIAILSLTAYSTGSCNDATDFMILLITPPPGAYAGADAEICETEGSYTISDATASNYASLLWTTSGDGTFDDATVINPTYTPGSGDITAGTVTLSLTAYANGSCADTTDSMVLTINQAPTVYAGADGEVCAQSLYYLTDATASNYSSLLWTTSGDGTFSDPYALNPTYTPGSGDVVFGSAFLTLTAYGNGSCADSSDTMLLTVSPQASAYAGPDAEICETAGGYTLSDATASNYMILVWSTSGDGTFDDNNLLNATYTPGSGDIANGVVTLSLMAYGYGSCPDVTDEMELSITSAPHAYAGADAEICESETYELLDATASNYASLMWTTSGDGTFSDPAALNPVYTPGSGDVILGYAFLTLKAYGNGSCEDSTDVMKLSITGDVSVYAGADAEVCESESYTIEDAEAENYASLLWSTSGDGSFDDASALNPVYTPGDNDISNGSVTLTLTAFGSGSCGDATDSMVLTITEAPTAMAGDDADICETDTYTLSDATATGYVSVSWTTAGDGQFDDPNALNPVYTPGSMDITSGGVVLTLTAYGNGSCEEISDDMILHIYTYPTVDAGDPGMICYGDEFQVNGAFAENYSSLQWTSSGDGTFSDPNILEPIYYAGPLDLQQGYADLTITAFGYGSCGAATDMVTVIINEVPVVDAGEDQIIELGAPTQLNGSASGGSGSYIWSWTPGDFIINDNAQNPQTFPIFQDTYFVLTVTDNLTGCSSSDTVLVSVEGPGPGSQPIANDDVDTTFVNASVVITALDNDYLPPDQFITVSLATMPQNGIVILNSDNTFTYTPYNGFTGMDTFSYSLCNDNAIPLCDTATVTIHVLPLDNIEDNIHIYSGFTPNGDGVNDNWIIEGIQKYPINEVKIFNRWGEIIREYSGYDNVNVSWNGTNRNNRVLPDGTYFYLLKIMYNGQEKFKKGWIYIHGVSN
jgi:gliding motility-associated-like protein